MSDMKKIIEDVMTELNDAIENWPKFNSAHEGFAILNEEMDELWDQVKVNQKRRDLDKMYSEAKQVAAMAIRYMHDVCNTETINK